MLPTPFRLLSLRTISSVFFFFFSLSVYSIYFRLVSFFSQGIAGSIVELEAKAAASRRCSRINRRFGGIRTSFAFVVTKYMAFNVLETVRCVCNSNTHPGFACDNNNHRLYLSLHGYLCLCLAFDSHTCAYTPQL